MPRKRPLPDLTPAEVGRKTLRRNTPVTIERIQAALDKLALAMDMYSEEGEVLLPIYGRLERDAAKLRTKEDAMARVRERAERVKAARTPLK